ncbi:putative ADP-ribosylation factor GTPase-activating protein AGD11-like [Capsicum annuum]|nr:putative ADP-ribosylation factor GTPase-activating protein AGD11-like [Capsicum annuum]
MHSNYLLRICIEIIGDSHIVIFTNKLGEISVQSLCKILTPTLVLQQHPYDMGADSDYRPPRPMPHGLYGCMSPSCIPVHEQYSRINTLTRGGSSWYRAKLWRKLLKKLVNEGKNVYGNKQKTLKFQYDAYSYAQNFDEGGREDEYYPRRQI